MSYAVDTLLEAAAMESWDTQGNEAAGELLAAANQLIAITAQELFN
jgi:hypothetical protein